jgi:hypothetical protein
LRFLKHNVENMQDDRNKGDGVVHHSRPIPNWAGNIEQESNGSLNQVLCKLNARKSASPQKQDKQHARQQAPTS